MRKLIINMLMAFVIWATCIVIVHTSVKRELLSVSLDIAELRQHTDALARQIVKDESDEKNIAEIVKNDHEEIIKMKADNEANDKYIYSVIKENK